MEEFQKIILRNIVVRFISIFCVFAFIKSPDDLPLYIAIHVIVYFTREYQYVDYFTEICCKAEWSKAGNSATYKANSGIVFPQIAVHIYTILDRTMMNSYWKYRRGWLL